MPTIVSDNAEMLSSQTPAMMAKKNRVLQTKNKIQYWRRCRETRSNENNMLCDYDIFKKTYKNTNMPLTIFD